MSRLFTIVVVVVIVVTACVTAVVEYQKFRCFHTYAMKLRYVTRFVLSDAGVREAWENTARTAAALGAAVVEVSMPSVPQVCAQREGGGGGGGLLVSVRRCEGNCLVHIKQTKRTEKNSCVTFLFV